MPRFLLRILRLPARATDRTRILARRSACSRDMRNEVTGRVTTFATIASRRVASRCERKEEREIANIFRPRSSSSHRASEWDGREKDGSGATRRRTGDCSHPLDRTAPTSRTAASPAALPPPSLLRRPHAGAALSLCQLSSAAYEPTAQHSGRNFAHRHEWQPPFSSVQPARRTLAVRSSRCCARRDAMRQGTIDLESMLLSLRNLQVFGERTDSWRPSAATAQTAH